MKKCFTLLAGLILLSVISNAQSTSAPKGQITKYWPYYIVDGNYISNKEAKRLIAQEPQTADFLKQAKITRRITNTLSLFGVGAIAMRTIVLSNNAPEHLKVNHLQTVVIGAATGICFFTGVIIAKSHFNDALDLYNSKQSDNQTGNLSFKVNFSGNGIGLMVQF